MESYKRDLERYQRDLDDWNRRNAAVSPAGRLLHYKRERPPKKPTKRDVYQEMFIAQTTVAVGVIFLFVWRAIRAVAPKA